MTDFINKGNKPTGSGFGEGLLKAAEINSNIVALGADITASVKVNAFAEKFPERFFSLGIAEQNCVGAAVGLAMAGKIPVFSTYAVFSALRTTDQIRVSVCYNNLHVIIGGAHAGISVGPDGATHQALEDIAMMRVLPNMTVLSPCDATQTKLATIAALTKIKGPVYIRYGREAMPDFTDAKQNFEIGKGQILREGTDVTIFATGHMTWEALQAAITLEKKGISVQVVNIHTIKPIDKDLIISCAQKTKAIVTAEEHQVYGGFGSAIAEVLAKHFPVPIEFIGMNDSFGESGKPSELMEKYGMTANQICSAVEKVLNRKKSK
ncbi:MAG TPA: transketolase C-terminal domain-containing protein [Bacteroidales bacterium]|nr:transketolase C-terminal domain-containing protein [Bacteroidales bacterium]HPS18502.1 transketolase C-terminal domain-containing protein [Bacteroidales bacterium]